TANIACGGHAGDGSTMRAACRAAAARGVAITAHVAYPDLQGFGRRFLEIAPDDLADQVVVQVGALQAMARAEGSSVRGVKPHGALYNALARHEAQAGAVVRALGELDGLPLVAAPGAVVVPAAEAAGLPVVLEGFADRAYLPDGTLTPRTRPGAVLTDPEAVSAQALSIATEGGVRAADGTWVDLPVRSLCLHGDTPGAVELARAVRARLEEAGVDLKAAL
ncbi:MAG TPA: LamB/YcsF family protein, partial [Brachybacterium paraconglomeratum]|nr:LamB/YcsF family protein [Brachybacterium paraconglomeratum]